MYYYLTEASVRSVVTDPEKHDMRELKKMLAPKFGLVLECKYYKSRWKEFFDQKHIRNELKKIETKLKDVKVYPDRKKIFRVFVYLEPEDIKVILLGQDPYHDGSACGIAFSVEGGGKTPPSLINIKRELEDDGFEKDDNDLLPWVEQGVFLLNTSLTVLPHQANSHASLWYEGSESFTNKLMEWLSEKKEYVILVLWGQNARSYKSYFGTLRSDIVESAHPSPLSAHNGFFGSRPFSKVNSFLKAKKMEEINWSL